MERDIRLQGHLIDDFILSRVLDAIGSLGASHEIRSLTIGQTRKDTSTAVVRIVAPDRRVLAQVLHRVVELGAEPLEPVAARLEPAPADGVLPDHFYATSNLPTEVLVNDAWLPVAGEEMDLAVVVAADRRSARAVPMAEVRAGELVVVGEEGVRVEPPPRDADPEAFRFMASEVSAEKPKGPLLQRVVRTLRRVKGEGKKVLLVGGPAIIHTGAGALLERLILQRWIDILFAGNALAVHDIEQALLGTSLGVPVSEDAAVREGHAHHLWAINAVRRAGSIAAAVESGLLRRGVMHACVRRQIPFVLAGSIRDDGPLPDVVTDAVAAQQAMRDLIPGVGMAIMVGSTLHAVATGNLLPARVFTVCVDINPGVVTKLQDRGSRQSVGIVMDAASFLEQLAAGLQEPGPAGKGR
jgi:lysine-ketoglutarate reductase/saccharopine dehydrogenase-like protein (TIGR00300 family)